MQEGNDRFVEVVNQESESSIYIENTENMEPNPNVLAPLSSSDQKTPNCASKIGGPRLI